MGLLLLPIVLVSFLDFKINIISFQAWGNLYDHSRQKELFTLVMNKTYIWVLKNMRKSGYNLNMNLLIILY